MEHSWKRVTLLKSVNTPFGSVLAFDRDHYDFEIEEGVGVWVQNKEGHTRCQQNPRLILVPWHCIAFLEPPPPE